MDAFTIFDRYGLPLLIIALVAIGIKRDLWPFLTTQLQQWQAERNAERKEYITSITALTTIANESHARHTAMMQTQTAQIETLAHSLLETVTTLKTMREEQLLILAYLENKKPYAKPRRAD